MLFNSFTFAVFLPLVFIAYWSLRRAPLAIQNTLVVVASYVFYGWWDYRFLSLIVVSTVVDFTVGIALGRTDAPRARKLLLTVSVFTNIGILMFFKYFDFFVVSFAELLRSVGLQPSVTTLNVILPVGISFYTFQTLSYTIDVYRGKLEHTRDAAAFFAFVSFFPQLVAGPIERASNLLPQFQRRREFDLVSSKDGMRQILGGFIKKVVIADNLAPHVEQVFSGYASLDGVSLLIGVFLFAMQIYCDFSGYSDIAIGTARLFGFDLMRNFAFPYFSRDIAEFWRRWHISLSSWFRDYVYIPLGGSRVGRARHIVNIICTFTISGLWHGANWTFVVWGFLNGLYYVPLMLRNRQREHTGDVAPGRLLPTVRDGLGIALTFSATLVAWVFFRAASIGDAILYIGGAFAQPWYSGAHGGFAKPLALGVVVLAIEWLQREREHALEISSWSVPARWSTYLVCLVALLILGNYGHREFIYFQF